MKRSTPMVGDAPPPSPKTKGSAILSLGEWKPDEAYPVNPCRTCRHLVVREEIRGDRKTSGQFCELSGSRTVFERDPIPEPQRNVRGLKKCGPGGTLWESRYGKNSTGPREPEKDGNDLPVDIRTPQGRGGPDDQGAGG